MNDSKNRQFLSLGLLLLFIQSCHYAPFASGQQGKPGFAVHMQGG